MSMRPFAKRELGRASVEVGELGLGIAPLGDLFDIVEESEAREMLKLRGEGGVAQLRYFSHAGKFLSPVWKVGLS